MSIHFIVGEPGGGKSLLGMKLIVEELVKGRRAVVTNIAVRLDELEAYIRDKYPGEVVDILRRVRILTEEQVREFWRYRGWRFGYDGVGGWVTMGPVIQNHERAPGYCDFSDSPGGVFYAIDEVHLVFPSRQWARHGLGFLFYGSQHRKLSDDVLLISNSPGQVDKQCREVAQDWTVCHNMAHRRLGPFSLGSRLKMSLFPGGQGPVRGEKAMSSSTWAVDVKGLAGCYDTAAGVGVLGKHGGDVGGRKFRGPPIWVAFVAIAVGAVLFAKVPMLIAGGLARVIGGWGASGGKVGAAFVASTSRATNVIGGAVPSEVGPSVPPRRARLGEVPAAGIEFGPPPVPTYATGVWVTAFCNLGDRVLVGLSDGRMLETGHPSLGRVWRDCVEVDGQRVKIR